MLPLRELQLNLPEQKKLGDGHSSSHCQCDISWQTVYWPLQSAQSLRSVSGHPPTTGDTNTPVWFHTTAEGRWLLRAGNPTLGTYWELCKASFACPPAGYPKPGGMPMAGMDGASGTFAPRGPVACNQPSQRDVPQLQASCNGTDRSDSFLEASACSKVL